MQRKDNAVHSYITEPFSSILRNYSPFETTIASDYLLSSEISKQRRKNLGIASFMQDIYFCEHDNTGPSMQATSTCIIHFRRTTHCAYCVGLNVLEESDVRT